MARERKNAAKRVNTGSAKMTNTVSIKSQGSKVMTGDVVLHEVVGLLNVAPHGTLGVHPSVTQCTIVVETRPSESGALNPQSQQTTALFLGLRL